MLFSKNNEFCPLNQEFLSMKTEKLRYCCRITIFGDEQEQTMNGMLRTLYFFGPLAMFFAFYLLAYQISRETFFAGLVLFSLSALGYYFLALNEKYRLRQLRHIFMLGVVCRLIFIVATPSWSDDFYRFLWDGHLVEEGQGLYSHTPRELMKNDSLRFEDKSLLFKQLNSPDYYSVYPPINQLFFSAAVVMGANHVQEMLWLRIFILAGEVLLFFLLVRWLNDLGKDPSLVAWYFLHPVVIMELSGNLHFEGWMMLLLLFSLQLIEKQKWLRASVFFALSVGLKFLPLLFLPLLKRLMDFRRMAIFSLLVLLFLMLSFIPFLHSGFNLHASLGLFFQRFEFNASLHYLIREAGNWFGGFNPLRYSGPVLMIVLAATTLFLSLRKKALTMLDLFSAMTFCLLLFYLFSSIVHPWYIINLLVLTLLAGFRFGAVWALCGFFSYAFYDTSGGNYYYHFVVLEYGLLAVFLLIERKQIQERLRFLISV